MSQDYKNDGFDLSNESISVVEAYYIIVDLENMKILGMYSNTELFEQEMAKLQNFNGLVTAAFAVAKSFIDCPVEFTA
jgi:hypothetical protein